MTKAAKWIIAATVFVVVIVGVYCLYDTLSQQYAPDPLGDAQNILSGGTSTTEGSVTEDGTADTEEVSYTAPDFTMLDTDGNEVRLSDYFGKPIILNFWASWCYYCDKEMPDFNEAFKTHADDIHFIMLNVTDGSRETLDSANAYIADAGYEFPVYYDTTLEAAMSYGASGLPMTFFIDQNGDLVTYESGMLTAENLARGIEMILPAEEES